MKNGLRPVGFVCVRVIPSLVLMLHFGAHARDPDPAVIAPHAPAPKVSVCEGFFTLGYHSELVIGSEERLDQLIDSGTLDTQAAVDAFDQDAFAHLREQKIRTFVSENGFGRNLKLPSGMKLRPREANNASSFAQTFFTAALDEQSTALERAIRTHAIFNHHVHLARSGNDIEVMSDQSTTAPPEVFAVRQSTSFKPTAADLADLRAGEIAYRNRFGRAVKMIGILWLITDDADTLIVYR